MQLIGSGALGPVAANAIRHVAAQNGVWSLGNFGGVPPQSAMAQAVSCSRVRFCLWKITSHTMCSPLDLQEAAPAPAEQPSTEAPQTTPFVDKIEEHEYRYVFNSCSVGMVSYWSSDLLCWRVVI